MKWIQIKNPKWIGGSAEEDVIPKSKTQSITWRRQRQLTWSGSVEEKCVWGRSAAWVWTWRWRRCWRWSGRRRWESELERPEWTWRWQRRWESELERLEMRDDNERERVNETGFDKMKKKKRKKKEKRSKLYCTGVSLTIAATLREWSLRGMRDERERVRMRVNEWLDLIKWIKNRNNEVRMSKI